MPACVTTKYTGLASTHTADFDLNGVFHPRQYFKKHYSARDWIPIGKKERYIKGLSRSGPPMPARIFQRIDVSPFNLSANRGLQPLLPSRDSQAIPHPPTFASAGFGSSSSLHRQELLLPICGDWSFSVLIFFRKSPKALCYKSSLTSILSRLCSFAVMNVGFPMIE